MPATRPLSAALALIGALPVGCAQFSAETQVRTIELPGAAPILRETRVIEAELEARWSQRGSELDVELLEHRRCQDVARVPARREEKTIRKPDAMIYWEYGLAAVALGVSALAFARPEAFAAVSYDKDTGVYSRDPKTGYSLGGVFAAAGTGFLIGGIVDSVRARDRLRVIETTVLKTDPPRPCDPPLAPANGRPIALHVAGRQIPGVTDDEGRVRFVVPAELVAPPEVQLLPASLQVPLAPELPISLVPPSRPTPAPHTGTVRAPRDAASP